jgi:hypothetical protein
MPVRGIGAANPEALKLLKDVRWELQQQRKLLETLRLQATAPVLDEVQAFAGQHQLSFEATMERLREDGASFARFGDGEFRLMLRSEYKLRFQSNSPSLQKGLREILQAPPSGSLLKGFPQVYRDVHWSGVWSEMWGQLSAMLPDGETFGNSHVTRPIFFELLGDRGVQLWREVWHNRSVTVVTGRSSRFELLDDLFDNIDSVQFVYSTPTEAWGDVPRLLDEVRQLPTTDLYLVALGPAGTVLTARMADRGMRALDIGHISDSYLTAFKGGAWPENKEITRPTNS